MKSDFTIHCWNKPHRLKLFRQLKLTLLFLLFATLQVSAVDIKDKITLKLQSAELKKALSSIEKVSDYHFLYNQSLVTNKPKVSLDVSDADISTVLNLLLSNTGIGYRLMDNSLVVLREEDAIKNFVPDIRITGKITGVSNEPLPGVSVSVKGTGGGTTTDANGDYAITVPDSNAILVFTSIGFVQQEIAVGNRTTINVMLAASTAELNPVVVVGYGTQRRRDVTGAYASIKGAELARQPVQTAAQALQGKVAGVQVISSGEPNAMPSIRLRGTGSILAGANRYM